MNKNYLHVEFFDGRLITARSAWELVHIMWGSSFGKEANIDQYMVNFAGRARKVFNIEIDTSSADNFLESLLSAGICEYRTIN